MGGEGDATNVVQAPVCSVFTSISMDHMAFLGNSLKSITEDKAGIIKYGFPVISQIQPGEVKEVIINKAQEKMSKVIFAGKYSGKTGIEGPGQDDNAGLAMEVATFVLKEILGRDYESMKEYFDDCIIKGIESAVNPGRFQKIFADKEIYMDGAHNEDASVKLKTFLEMYFTNRPIIFIMGVLKDKDYKSICRNLCSVAYKMITITPQNARGLDGQILLDTIREINKDVAFGSYSYENAANEAISLYNDLSEKGKEPVMLVCGSLSILSDMREIFKGKEKSVN